MPLMKIKPYDNTFFRDGSKFDKDFSTVVSGKNTPYPSVFWGAIFTTLLSENDVFREKYMSNLENYNIDEILKIKQVYIYNEKEDKTYIKAPLDLFINKKGQVQKGKFKKIKNSSLNMDCMLEIPEGDFERVDKKYIEISIDFEDYLNNYVDNIKLIDENDIFIQNYKIGLGLDINSRIAVESMLYKIEYTEFINNDWSYIIEYKLEDFKTLEKGDLRLGGEGKIAKFEEIKDIQDIYKLKTPTIDSKIYKIILTSETYFEKDIGKYFENPLKLLGISNEKPISIGGYDMKKKKYKTMYKGYSAGTILLIEAQEFNEEKLKEIFAENSKGFNQYIITKGEINE